VFLNIYIYIGEKMSKTLLVIQDNSDPDYWPIFRITVTKPFQKVIDRWTHTLPLEKAGRKYEFWFNGRIIPGTAIINQIEGIEINEDQGSHIIACPMGPIGKDQIHVELEEEDVEKGQKKRPVLGRPQNDPPEKKRREQENSRGELNGRLAGNSISASAKPRQAPARARRNSTAVPPPSDLIKIAFKQENPKKKGSQAHIRYEKYKDAKTEREYYDLNGTKDDWKYDLARGFLTILE